MKTQQPTWEPVANLGDANPIDNGGLTVHYAAGCDKGYATIWKPLVVGHEIKPPEQWECVDCRRLEADGWLGEEVDCEPPEIPGRIVTVYGEAATGNGSVSLRWGRRGEPGSILATYRFDAKLV